MGNSNAWGANSVVKEARNGDLTHQDFPESAKEMLRFASSFKQRRASAACDNNNLLGTNNEKME